MFGALARRNDHMPSQLVLTIIKAPLEDWVGQTRHFDASGGSLGRTNESSWMLADPQRIISRVHARVSFEKGRFLITDQSMNGVYLNGGQNPIGASMTVPLQEGDIVQIGHYQFKVSVLISSSTVSNELPADLEPLDFLDEPEPIIAEKPVQQNWGQNEVSRAGVCDPLKMLNIKSILDDDALDGGWDKMAMRGETGSPLHQAMSANAIIPENWDQDEVPILTSWEAPANDAFKKIEFPDAEPSKPAPADVVVRKAEINPLKSVQHSELSALLSVYISDFLNQEGTVFSPEQIEQMMQQWGDVLRASVAGIMQALLARGAMKNELRITSTLVKPLENNPLKFSISVEDALDKLFNRRARGFMPPVEAVEDAFRDIAEHQLALMTASREVSKRIMKRFEPQLIEQTLKKKGRSKLKSLKAQLWDEYCLQMNEVMHADSSSLQTLFNQEYAKAYEEALQGIKRPVRGRHAKE